MQRFDGEPSEVLMHSLWTAFNVGKHHTNHLCISRSRWRARSSLRRQTFDRVTQSRNEAAAETYFKSIFASVLLHVAGYGYKFLAARHVEVRALLIGLRIGFLSQRSGDQ
jgi:hypothetical protein